MVPNVTPKNPYLNANENVNNLKNILSNKKGDVTSLFNKIKEVLLLDSTNANNETTMVQTRMQNADPLYTSTGDFSYGKSLPKPVMSSFSTFGM